MRRLPGRVEKRLPSLPTHATGLSGADREFAIQQILDRAIVSTEILGILAGAGIATPDHLDLV